MMNIKQLGHHSHHNLSSENVVIGADEIDSECRTEDDDHCQENNLSCEGGAAIDFDKESKWFTLLSYVACITTQQSRDWIELTTYPALLDNSVPLKNEREKLPFIY